MKAIDMSNGTDILSGYLIDCLIEWAAIRGMIFPVPSGEDDLDSTIPDDADKIKENLLTLHIQAQFGKGHRFNTDTILFDSPVVHYCPQNYVVPAGEEPPIPSLLYNAATILNAAKVLEGQCCMARQYEESDARMIIEQIKEAATDQLLKSMITFDLNRFHIVSHDGKGTNGHGKPNAR